MDIDAPTRWVGLVEVTQPVGSEILGSNRGAYVTVVAWCQSEDEFRSVVQKSLGELGLLFVDAEEIETFSNRMQEYTVPNEFLECMSEVGPDIAVAFMDFHTFPQAAPTEE